jgi:FRG domain
MAKLRKTVKSLAQFVEWVEAVSDKFRSGGEYPGIWFRGVADSRYRLLPGLYRQDPGGDTYADTDDELRYEFGRRARALTTEIRPQNDWEWYFIMQHYRLPTRLLDWTDAAFVALHFAVQSCEGTARPAVWALNPFAMNERLQFLGPVGIDWRRVERYLPRPYQGWGRMPKDPIALDPPLVAQRMMVQHSHFTLHGTDRRPLEEMEALRGEAKLTRVVIDLPDKDDREFLLWQLGLCAIMETSLFPDLEGLSRELVHEYGLSAKAGAVGGGQDPGAAPVQGVR